MILLVEDNPDDVELTIRAFERSGITNRVDVVRDGVEALDYVLATGVHADRDPAELPQVILLDLGLPRLSGLDVLVRLREHPATRRVPVVVLTSSILDKDKLSSYDRGCNGYVRKPVEFVEFVEVVSRIGMYWILTNESPPTHPDS